MRFLKGLNQYAYNMAVLGSQFISVLLGGHPDESISQRVGRAYLVHGNNSVFNVMRQVIDFVFYVLFKETDHTLKSVEKGEGKAKALWDWSKKE